MEEAKVTQEEAESAKEDAGKEPFEEKEEDTSTNPEEEETSETSEEKSKEETSSEEGQETSKEPDKANQELEEKNKQLFARAKKAEEKLKEAEKASKPATGDPMEAVRLGKALADVSEEEADVIITYAKGKFDTLTPTPEQIIQASKDEWITTAISAKREKVAGDNKTPEPSSPSSVIGGKTEEELEKMDNTQFAKHIKEDMKGRRIGT